MYNLLIADDNLMYVKCLANNILSKDKYVRLVKIATDGDEVYQYIKNEKIDLLLLDIKMPIYSGIEVLKKIDEDKSIYVPKVIIISGEINEENYKLYYRYNVIACMHKNWEIEKITKEVTNIMSGFEKNKISKQIENFVWQELLNLNYNAKHKGTIYIKESIMLILNMNNDIVDNLEKNVYVYVASKYGTSTENIKNNIVKATNNMYTQCKIEFLLEYFSFKEDIKPTPKFVISTIINKVIKENNERLWA